MKFPDTSLNSLALLVVAGLLTAVTGAGLEMAYGDPTTPGADALITIVALGIGFGGVYGAIALRAYLRSNTGSTQTVSER